MTARVGRDELLSRLEHIRDHGSDPLRFIESAREDGEITTATARWLSEQIKKGESR